MARRKLIGLLALLLIPTVLGAHSPTRPTLPREAREHIETLRHGYPLDRVRAAERLAACEDLRVPRVERALIVALRDPIADVRLAAIDALARVGTERAVEPLLRAAIMFLARNQGAFFDGNDEMNRAMDALVHIRTGVEPLLMQVWNIPSDPWRDSVVRTLGRIGATDALETLFLDLPSPRQGGKLYADSMFAATMRVSTLSYLAHRAPDISPEAWIKAVDVLQRLHDETSLQSLLTASRHDDPTVRRRALDALHTRGYHFSIERIDSLASDPSPEVRLFAIRELRDWNDPHAFQIVRRALDDPDRDILMELCSFHADAFDDSDAIDMLEDLLYAGKEFAEGICVLLANLPDPRARDVLYRYYRNTADAAEKERIPRYLRASTARARDWSVVDSLWSMFPSGEPCVDASIVEMLAMNGYVPAYRVILDSKPCRNNAPKARDLLQDLVRAAPDSLKYALVDSLIVSLREPDVRPEVMWATMRCGGARAVRPLVEAIIGCDAERRRRLVESLKYIAVSSLAGFADLVNHDNPEVRAIAATAMGGNDDPRAWRPLMVLLNDPVPKVRAAAYAGIGHNRHPDAGSALAAGLSDPDSTVVFVVANGISRLYHPIAPELLPPAGVESADTVATLLERARRRSTERPIPADPALRGEWLPWTGRSGFGIRDTWFVRGEWAMAVGERGNVLRWDGEQWAFVGSPTPENLNAVWVSEDGKDTWIVGDSGVVVHYDYADFEVEQIAAVDLYGVAGNDDGAVCAVGWGGAAFLKDGSAWRKLRGGLLPSLRYVAPGDDGTFMAVGDAGSMVRIGAERCTMLDAVTTRELTDLVHIDGVRWVAASRDTSYVIDDTSIHAYRSSSARYSIKTSRGTLLALDSYARLFDGATWRSVNPDTILRAPTRLASGRHIIIENPEQRYRRSLRPSIADMWANPRTHELIGIYDHRLCILSDPTMPSMALEPPEGDYNGELNLLDGADGSMMVSGFYWAAWYRRAGPDYVVANGRGSLIRLDVASRTRAYALGWEAARGNEDAYSLMSTAGCSWNAHAIPRRRGYGGLYATRDGDVFLTAEVGRIQHYDGRRWETMKTPEVGYLRDLWGSSARDVWGLGEEGVMVHFDGREWSRVDFGASRWLTHVWGRGPNDVYVGGTEGKLYHYDGRNWKRLNPLLKSIEVITGDETTTYVSSGSSVVKFERDTVERAGR